MIHTHTTTTAFFSAQAVLAAAPLEFPPAAPAPVDLRSGRAIPIRRDGPAGRFYEIDGELYPSVTHVNEVIAKRALIKWAADQERTAVLEAATQLYEDCGKLPSALPRSSFLATLAARLPKLRAHQRALVKAGDIGQQTHALVERSLRVALGQVVPGPVPPACAEAVHAFKAFQAWARSVSLKPKHIEQIVYSRTHQFAGTLDLVAEVNGRELVIDFKTGRAIYGEAFLQNVAYQEAYAEMGHGRVAGGLVIRLPKQIGDPDFEVGVVPPAAALYPTFLAARALFTWWHAQEEAGKAARRTAAITARRSAA